MDEADVFSPNTRDLDEEKYKRGDLRREVSLRSLDLSHWMTLM